MKPFFAKKPAEKAVDFFLNNADKGVYTNEDEAMIVTIPKCKEHKEIRFLVWDNGEEIVAKVY